MPQQFLDRTQVGPPFQQMGSEGMAQGMGGNFLDGGQLQDVLVDDARDTSAGEAPARER